MKPNPSIAIRIVSRSYRAAGNPGDRTPRGKPGGILAPKWHATRAPQKPRLGAGTSVPGVCPELALAAEPACLYTLNRDARSVPTHGCSAPPDERGTVRHAGAG